jgi:restriction endonuclease Mrr
MSVPDFQSFMLPLLKRCVDGGEHPLAFSLAQLAGDLAISQEDTKAKLPSGTQTRYQNRIYWAAIYLRELNRVAVSAARCVGQPSTPASASLRSRTISAVSVLAGFDFPA